MSVPSSQLATSVTRSSRARSAPDRLLTCKSWEATYTYSALISSSLPRGDRVWHCQFQATFKYKVQRTVLPTDRLTASSANWMARTSCHQRNPHVRTFSLFLQLMSIWGLCELLRWRWHCDYLVTTARRVFMLRWRPPDKEGTCGYTEYAVSDSRQGVALQLWDLEWS
jgi:hypothetical protein